MSSAQNTASAPASDVPVWAKVLLAAGVPLAVGAVAYSLLRGGGGKKGGEGEEDEEAEAEAEAEDEEAAKPKRKKSKAKAKAKAKPKSEAKAKAKATATDGKAKKAKSKGAKSKTAKTKEAAAAGPATGSAEPSAASSPAPMSEEDRKDLARSVKLALGPEDEFFAASLDSAPWAKRARNDELDFSPTMTWKQKGFASSDEFFTYLDHRGREAARSKPARVPGATPDELRIRAREAAASALEEFKDRLKAPRALELFSKAIALDPSNAKMYINRGMVYVRLGHYYRALVDAASALELQPSAKAYYLHGRVCVLLRRTERAVADLDRVFAFPHEPAHALALNLLASLVLNTIRTGGRMPLLYHVSKERLGAAVERLAASAPSRFLSPDEFDSSTSEDSLDDPEEDAIDEELDKARKDLDPASRAALEKQMEEAFEEAMKRVELDKSDSDGGLKATEQTHDAFGDFSIEEVEDDGEDYLEGDGGGGGGGGRGGRGDGKAKGAGAAAATAGTAAKPASTSGGATGATKGEG
jgi:tetratricopeptide (TPR) repeat protein